MNINITVSLGLVLGCTGISYGDQMWPSDPVILLFTTCILLQNFRTINQRYKRVKNAPWLFWGLVFAKC